MTGIHADATELVGGTPLVRLDRIAAHTGARVLAKLEYLNPGSSVKDRIGLSMIEAAEADGRLRPGGRIIEGTSGNTGIALAWIGAIKGYRVTIVLPSSLSLERRRLLEALGAELVLVDGPLSAAGAKVAELLEADPGAFVPGQGGNPANPAAHVRTAEEIWADTDGRVDILVATAGTGGTVTGAGRALKERNTALEVVAVEPAEAALLSGGEYHEHGIQGIGGDALPPILVDSRELIDEVVAVPSATALEVARLVARTEGLVVGISSGAAVAAALEVAARPENAGKTLVTVLPDTGERYISTELFQPTAVRPPVWDSSEAGADVEIRKARPEEYPEVGAVLERAYGHFYEIDDDYRDDLRHLERFDGLADVWAAFETGKVVGALITPAAGLPSNYVVNPTLLEIGFRLLGVDPGHQGRGVARALIEFVVRLGRAGGARRLGVYSAAHMHPAHRLYERLGFTRQPWRDNVVSADNPTALLAFVLDLPEVDGGPTGADTSANETGDPAGGPESANEADNPASKGTSPNHTDTDPAPVQTPTHGTDTDPTSRHASAGNEEEK
jgi:cysteine synthase A